MKVIRLRKNVASREDGLRLAEAVREAMDPVFVEVIPPTDSPASPSALVVILELSRFEQFELPEKTLIALKEKPDVQEV